MKKWIISLFILCISSYAYADMCDDIYINNQASWDRNDGLQICKDALRGDADAQFDLAGWFSLFENDKKEARKWVKKSADQGCAKSRFVLGLMYYNGEGAKKDPYKAFPLIKSAARSGLPHAQVTLGAMYQYGEGTEKNTETAILWYQKAAAQNNDKALISLGEIYQSGDGVQVNRKKAEGYFMKAKEVAGLKSDNTYPCDRYRDPG